MSFQISSLDPGEFQHLFNADEESLERAGVVRMRANAKPGFPCRVSLQDAEIGESVLLMNYEHQPAETPFRSSHAIFIRENAVQAGPVADEVPELLRGRLLSIRGFSSDDMIVDADVVQGGDLDRAINTMLSNDAVEYVHVHNAKLGCYMARVDRLQ